MRGVEYGSAARRALAVVALLLLAACSVKRTELARIVSPDHRAIAVLVREDAGGAAGSTAYYLYLVDAQSKKELDHPNLTGIRCEGLSIAWEDSTTLQVNYDSKCAIKQFLNRWYSSSGVSNVQPAYVEIVLVRLGTGHL
jgi:hypothetical protein